jgi:hypothetical protein
MPLVMEAMANEDLPPGFRFPLFMDARSPGEKTALQDLNPEGQTDRYIMYFLKCSDCWR